MRQTTGIARGVLSGHRDPSRFRMIGTIGLLIACFAAIALILALLHGQRSADEQLASAASLREQQIRQILPPPDANTASAILDAQRGEWILQNDRVTVILGVQSTANGTLSVISRQPTQWIVDRSTPSVELNGVELSLKNGTARSAATPTHADVPGFGSSTELVVPFDFPDGHQINVDLALLDETPAFLLRLQPVGSDSDQGAEYRYLNGAHTILLGDGARYLTDASQLRSGVVHNNGSQQDSPIDFGKPLLLWGGTLPSAVLLATVDETDRLSRFSASLPNTGVLADFSYRSTRTRPMGVAPRMYLEVTGQTSPGPAFARYRDSMDRLYPSKSAPSWVRYQWSTWYPYALDYTAQDVREAVDFISENLSDLGPWHIVMDAGSYISEGKPGSDFQTVDPSKFPEGIRPVVDYAHAKGVHVVLYLSTPYVDSRRKSGDWVGLRGLVNSERSCLEQLTSDPSGTSFIFDFLRPCTEQYWGSLLKRYFNDYDVDGVIIDGVGAADAGELTPSAPSSFGLLDSLTRQTMEIYRFMGQTISQLKPDAYVETEWHLPTMAKPYSTTFRVADSWDDFSHPYPYTGVLEDIDYAAFQQVALDQRAHMGWTMGDPNDSDVNRWRQESALAMAGLYGDGINLQDLSNAGLTQYRARLALHKPFQGKTVVDNPLHPKVVGTIRDNLAFVGMVNRRKSIQTITAHLQDFGLPPDKRQTVYSPDDDYARLGTGSIEEILPAESFHLDVVPQQPGVVWTESSFDQRTSQGGLELTLKGPTRSHGFAVVYAPGLKSVSFDGQRVHPSDAGSLSALHPGEASYDSETGILRIRFRHDQPHLLQIRL